MMLFVSGFLLCLSLCLDLGVVNTAMLRAGMRDGFKPAFALGLGSCLGDMVYAVGAVFGMSALLSISSVRWFLWIAGTLVLAGFTLKMFRESIHPPDWMPAGAAVPAVKPRFWRAFAQGAGLALASPTAILWYAAIGGAVIAATARESPAAILPFFAGYLACGLVWALGVSALASQGRRFGTGFVRTVSVISTIIFALLAAFVFWDGYTRLILGVRSE